MPYIGHYTIYLNEILREYVDCSHLTNSDLTGHASSVSFAAIGLSSSFCSCASC